MREVNPRTVSFSGDAGKYLELTSDNGEVTYKAPHWYHANNSPEITPGVPLLARNRPVAYVQGSKIKLAAKFRAKGFDWQSGLSIRAKINGTIDLPETWCTMASDGYLTLPETVVDQALGDTVQFYSAQESNAFNIAWEYYVDYNYVTGQPNWKSAGTTKHTVYVVKAAPVTTMRQESLFNIACKTADGKSSSSTDQQIVDAVFTEFEDRKVYKVEPSKGMSQTTPMSYKHDASVPTTGGAKELIELGKGRCGHWASLLQNCLSVHGITNSQVAVIVPEEPQQLGTVSRFYAAYQAENGTLLPILNDSGVNEALLYIKAWNIADVWVPAKGSPIPAQGNTSPQMYFANHVLVEFGTQKYDPSYGAKYQSFDLWEAAALEAIGAWHLPGPPLDQEANATFWIAAPEVGGSRQTSN